MVAALGVAAIPPSYHPNPMQFIVRPGTDPVAKADASLLKAMGFKPEMFTVMFAIPRTVGWLAQWEEMMEDGDLKISRPRQIYVGSAKRDFVPITKRRVAKGNSKIQREAGVRA